MEPWNHATEDHVRLHRRWPVLRCRGGSLQPPVKATQGRALQQAQSSFAQAYSYVRAMTPPAATPGRRAW